MNKNGEIFIPDNYKNSLKLFGVTVKMANLIQGIILFIIPFFVGIFIIPKILPIPIMDVVMFCTTVSMVTGGIGILGYDGESIGTFVKRVLIFKKNKRKTYYNPRIKKEAKSIFYNNGHKEKMLPREKILSIVEKYKTKYNAKTIEQAKEKIDVEIDGNVFFEDDEGIIDKPLDYLSNKEIKAIKKKKKKYEKELKKKARKELQNSERKEKDKVKKTKKSN